jgi:hypothetical protein
VLTRRSFFTTLAAVAGAVTQLKGATAPAAFKGLTYRGRPFVADPSVARGTYYLYPPNVRWRTITEMRELYPLPSNGLNKAMGEEGNNA